MNTMAITMDSSDGPDWSEGTLEATARLESRLLDQRFGEIVTDLGTIYWERVKNEKKATTMADLLQDFTASYGGIYSSLELQTARRIIEAYFGSFHPVVPSPARDILESVLAGERHYSAGIPNPPGNENTE
jgi:hypothetical protein